MAKENENPEGAGQANPPAEAEFNPQAFLEGASDNPLFKNPPVEPKPGEAPPAQNEPPAAAAADEDFVWPETPDLNAAPPAATEPPASTEPPATVPDNKTVPPAAAPEKVELDPKQVETIIKELGIEAKSLDEVKEVLNNIVEENKKLKAAPGQVVNKKIEELQNFLKLDDETLVRKSFEADGIKGEKVDRAIERLVDNGLIEIEAHKIRNVLDRAIQSESDSIIESDRAAEAKLQKAREDKVTEFNEFMSKQDTLFGFKITSKADQLPVVQKQHAEYVTSGKFLSEIVNDPKNLAEVSWMWRNKETIAKALANRGKQQGRKEILENLGNPSPTGSVRLAAPDNSDEFDPKKFMQS